MNSKERVKAVMNRGIPDKVPCGDFAIDFDTVEKVLGHETYLRAKAKSQIAFWEGRRDEVIQSWKEDTIEFHRKIDVFDIVNLSAMASSLAPPKGYQPEAPKRVDEKTWMFPDGRVYKYSDVTADITLVEDPEMWTRTFKEEDFDLDEEPEPPDPSVFEVVDAVIEALGDERYILGPSGGEVAMVLLGGMERGLVEYATNPEVVKRATRAEVNLANKRDSSFIRKGIDGILWGQDFAYKSGPFISPEMFREYCLPAIKARTNHIKENFGLKVFKHACGNNWALLDMFVEGGYDCYQSIQTSAGMDLKSVKEKYGDKLVLWGGVSVENLVSGAKEDIVDDVNYAMRCGKPRGGYIFGSTHSIAVGTRYDNFMTMIDEFLKQRDY